MPPRKEPTDLSALLKFVADHHLPCYFLGDLNALHPSLGHQRENNKGKIITDVIRRGGLNYAGPDFNTFFGARGKKGKPDIVLTNRHTYLNFHLEKDECYGSNHIAIIMQLGTAPIRQIIKPRYNHKKADWVKIKHNLRDYANICESLEGKEEQDVDRATDDLLSHIKMEKEKHIPIIKERTLPGIKLKSVMKNKITKIKNIVLKIDRGTAEREEKIQLCSIRAEIRILFKEAREEMWETLIRKTDGEEPGKFWKSIKRMLGGKSNTNWRATQIKNNEGEIITSEEAWEKHAEGKL